MLLEHTFTVPVGVDAAWDILLDVRRIAPCMPGATLTEFDGERFAGTVKVKVGPINLTYQGTGGFTERDEAARRVAFALSGRETRGSGTASATVTGVLREEDGATRVDVSTELSLTGRPAQFGRGMVGEVSNRLLGQFAACLCETLSNHAPPAETPAEAEPIDLLEVTGATDAARRYGPYLLAFFAGAALVWLFARRRRLGS